LFSRGDFLAPILSLRMARVGLEYKAEFEWLMRVLVTPYLLTATANSTLGFVTFAAIADVGSLCADGSIGKFD
jgi:hypothetical protein